MVNQTAKNLIADELDLAERALSDAVRVRELKRKQYMKSLQYAAECAQKRNELADAFEEVTGVKYVVNPTD